eukprot:6628597-Prymnesium_polylepis.1
MCDAAVEPRWSGETELREARRVSKLKAAPFGNKLASIVARQSASSSPKTGKPSPPAPLPKDAPRIVSPPET